MICNFYIGKVLICNFYIDKVIICNFYIGKTNNFYLLRSAWATVGKKSVRKNMILVHILSFDSDEVGTSSLF